MAKFDITRNTHAVDALLERTENPLHRQILENWRRHMLLEVSGNWEGILAPDMTVRDPDYRMSIGGKLEIMRGLDAVGAFYEGLVTGGGNVILLTNQEIVVTDNGYATNVNLTFFHQGHELAAQGHTGLDDDKWYTSEGFFVEFWPYTKEGLLVGEYVAQMSPPIIREVDEADVITPAEAKAALEPLIRPLPAYPA
ncbi:hypothetical protein [Aeromicrobium sp. UC242_57]|uniref:hypothetical protein n=1 Tax=Aeromicrobium sp. UC242_57 TaxID=3374624 RepID=UPI0037BC56B9